MVIENKMETYSRSKMVATETIRLKHEISHHDCIVFGRHGDRIPKPVNGLNRRIGSQHGKNRFAGYTIVSDIVDMHMLISQSASNPTQLYVLTHAASNEKLLEFQGLVPGNLKSAEEVMGIHLADELSYAELLRQTISVHGDAFLLGGGFSAWQSNRYQKQVERNLRTKSPLDDWFYHVPYGVNTLHLKALEMRQDRALIGVDFNTMYPSCFNEENFPHAGRLKHSTEGPELYQLCMEDKIAGAFRCVIESPDAFMQKYHWLALAMGDVSPHVNLPDRFIALLHANEIKFWSKHARIVVIEGVLSRVLTQHPLNNLAKKIYERRLACKAGSKALAKQELVLMHASTARALWKSADQLALRERYGFRHDFIETMDEGALQLPLISNNANVYSLQRQVLANARIKLFSEIERLETLFPQAELCYANVDSLHYSMPAEMKDGFIAALDVGSNMGQLKVEFVGTSGLWLDPGRWWIADGRTLVAHRSGERYLTPNYRNMSLHHHFVTLSKHETNVRPVDCYQDRDELSEQLPALIRKNVGAVKELWRHFSCNLSISQKGSSYVHT